LETAHCLENSPSGDGDTNLVRARLESELAEIVAIGRWDLAIEIRSQGRLRSPSTWIEPARHIRNSFALGFVRASE